MHPTESPAAFVYWPHPSPTSVHNINVRYYRLERPGSGTTVDWDIGGEFETAFESLYEAMLLTDKPGLTPVEFERYVRDFLDKRLAFMADMGAHPALLALILQDATAVTDDMLRQVQMLQDLQKRATHWLSPTKKPWWKTLFS